MDVHMLEGRRGEDARRRRLVLAIGLCTAALLPGCKRGSDDGMGLSVGLDGGESETAGDDGDEIPADLDPAPATLRLLLQRQYVGAVEELLGPEAAAAADPPENHAINGFDAVGAAQLALGDAEIDAYERSARAVAEAAAAAGTLDTWLACDPVGAGNEACIRQVVGSFGRRAWRRPLTDEEIERYTAVGTAAAADLGGFEAGLRAAIAALLQSPYFLYQVEVGEPDPDDPSRRRLTQYELASRISFFLLDTVPDAELLDDAEAGLLYDSDGIREAAWRLLERPRARESLGEFFGEAWRLRNLVGLPKDLATFPQWTPELAEAMRGETLALIEDLAWEQEADFREVFMADYTFVNARLGFHYGLPGAAELSDTHTKVSLAGHDKRGGLFGHGGFLSLLGHVSSTSPTLRGKFVLENILCRTVPPPPPGVVTDLPTNDGSVTMRERLEAHMSDPSCRGCHEMMDPIGFGLENYDGIGRFRTEDNGQPIDSSAVLDGEAFDGAASLGTIVASSPDSAHCLVRNLYRHATGHIEGPGEEDALLVIEDAFAESGYRMQDLMVEIVASPAFRVVAEPE
ncbi:DUF1592 domain-containing protein [Paraliomyxa miuraensis]|uniref:DUF1592 domain-containing protein n=1 Tax=Paraliomyxa miuraensis TaxID=376150 RepID=UPI00224CFBCD|nr:DUF1592 domain-containing protein [Paraliomyxa miuraensis]